MVACRAEMNTFSHTNTPTHLQTHTHTRTRTHAHAHAHSHAHTHTHTGTHTGILTHTHRSEELNHPTISSGYTVYTVGRSRELLQRPKCRQSWHIQPSHNIHANHLTGKSTLTEFTVALLSKARKIKKKGLYYFSDFPALSFTEAQTSLSSGRREGKKSNCFDPQAQDIFS